VRRLSIHWLLLGVAFASVLLPGLAIFSLRSFDAVLVRQTERELNAQGALIASAYQEAWSEAHHVKVGDPRNPRLRQSSYTPLDSRVRDLSRLSPPLPSPLPARTSSRSPAESAIEQRLTRVLSRAQVFNLSGIRVLDREGCAIASSRAQLDRCFFDLPEVKTAMAGKAESTLRKRVSDEPSPPLASFSRRGDVRVFVALPIWNAGTQIGTVLLSRTAESGIEWLFKQRRDVFYSVLLMLGLAVGISLSFSLLITLPLRRMRRRLSQKGPSGARLGDIPAPAEIQMLGLALDERSHQLEEKTRYVAEFAANVSHELKTPLTSIQGAVELLRDQSGEMDDEQRSRFLSNISDATERTARLVSRLLKLARLEANQGGEGDESISVSDFFAQLKLKHGASLNLSVNAPDGGKFPADPLESIVTNLVDNALRYRRENPVDVKFRMPEEGLVSLSVQDDGPGISADNQAKLFERFFTTERDRGGTGLGLSIVEAVATSRGGEVRITSNASGTLAEATF